MQNSQNCIFLIQVILFLGTYCYRIKRTDLHQGFINSKKSFILAFC
jgi:hypothetical protein